MSFNVILQSGKKLFNPVIPFPAHDQHIHDPAEQPHFHLIFHNLTDPGLLLDRDNSVTVFKPVHRQRTFSKFKRNRLIGFPFCDPKAPIVQGWLRRLQVNNDRSFLANIPAGSAEGDVPGDRYNL